MKALLALFFSMASAMFAGLSTDRIAISSKNLATEITDEVLLQKFAFGPGPGNFSNGTPMIRNWIADWSKPASEPDAGLPRYTVTFHLRVVSFTQQNGELREYQVTFVYSKDNRRGYIYLPGPRDAHFRENVSLIWRGPAWDGHWFEAVDEWTDAARAAISRARE